MQGGSPDQAPVQQQQVKGENMLRRTGQQPKLNILYKNKRNKKVRYPHTCFKAPKMYFI